MDVVAKEGTGGLYGQLNVVSVVAVDLQLLLEQLQDAFKARSPRMLVAAFSAALASSRRAFAVLKKSGESRRVTAQAQKGAR